MTQNYLAEYWQYNPSIDGSNMRLPKTPGPGKLPMKGIPLINIPLV